MKCPQGEVLLFQADLSSRRLGRGWEGHGDPVPGPADLERSLRCLRRRDGRRRAGANCPGRVSAGELALLGSRGWRGQTGPEKT